MNKGRVAPGVCEILVPGLGPGIPRDWLPAAGRAPALERLLARGERAGPPLPGQEAVDSERILGARLGFNVGNDRDLPLGALEMLGRGQKPSDAYWLRADPVHLQVDRDQLVLFAPTDFPFASEAANRIVERFNAHFATEGWVLAVLASPPGRAAVQASPGWYLRAPRPLHLRTEPLHKVDGRSILGHLPTGEDAVLVRRLLAEAEMLLHQARMPGSSMPPSLDVQSLWLWGGGMLPEPGSPVVDSVMTSEPWARGAACRAGVELCEDARAAFAPGRRTVCYTEDLRRALATGDPAACLSAFARIDGWVAAARHAGASRVCLGDSARWWWCADMAGWNRWWSRTRPLADRLGTHGAGKADFHPGILRR